MPGPAYQPKPFINSSVTHFCPPPSPSIDEKALGEVDASDYLITAAFEAMKSCRVAAQNTHTACSAIHADTTLSEGARHVAASEVANKVISRPLPLVDAAGQKIAAEIVRLESKIKQPPVDSTIRAANLAHEVRVYLRGLPPTERTKTLTQSLGSGDDQILSAIMTAPACLSGLSDTDVSNFALAWRQKRFPNELARIAALERANKALYLGGQLLISYGQKMAAPAIVSEAKKFKQASADAIRQATGTQ